MMKRCLWLAVFFVAGLLAACGGGGSDGTTSGTTSATGITSGVAVDPYIRGAHFDELSADRQSVIQSTSSPSDTNGAFTFDNALADGSIIQIKSTAKGQHANAPYEGVIKRQVFDGDSEPLVVSPLTTLLANGMAPSAVVQMLQGAGFSGLSVNDLYTDPMAGLINKTGNVTDADLVLLQANMAVHSFMVANQNFNYGSASPTASDAVAFADCAALVKETINPVIYQDLSTVVGADFTVGDLAETAVTINRTVVNQIQQDIQSGATTVSAATIDQYMNNAMADADMIAGDVYQARTGMSGGGTTTPPSNTLDGQTVFTNKGCVGCHTVGTGTGNTELSGDGSMVNSRFSGGTTHYNNLTLTADEITAVATYLDGQAGTTDPGTTDPGTGTGGTGGGTTTPLTGDELYARDCQMCHGSLAASNINDRSTTGIQSAIASVGSMGSINLSSSEIQSISDALTGSASTPPATTDPGTGTGGGTATCGSCHSVPPSDSDTDFQAGAHAVHTALADVGTDCDTCHSNATHLDGWVDLGFPATTWDVTNARVATDNMDGTCSNISCHGGQQTPDWTTGTIDVATQCEKCHEYGTNVPNSFYTGMHDYHVNRRNIDCSSCHDPAKLQNGHFDNLSTKDFFEQRPEATLRSELGYSNGTCARACHGSESWQ